MIDITASLAAAAQQNAEGCVKTAEDLDRYREVIRRVRPACIVECLPGGQLVVGAETAVRAVRRPYSGPMIHVSAAGGHEFSATPNHPVLTRRGWIKAGSLQKGDYLVSDSLLERMRLGDPHIHDVPTPIGEVFDSLQVRARERGPLEGVDLERSGPDGEIEVVAPDGPLRLGTKPAVHQPTSQFVLAAADLRAGSLAGQGTGLKRRFVHSTTPDGVVRLGLHGGVAPKVAEHTCHGRFSSRPRFMARPAHGGSDSRSGHAVLGGQGFAALTGQVPTHRVLRVGCVPYDGHVFNLQTTTGCYGAGGVIVHNCGTFSGKSALWFQQTARCPVVTVDVHPVVDDDTAAAAGYAVVWIHGSSVDNGIAETVRASALSLAKGGPIMVVLDSDHSGQHVYDEMTLYASLVTPGSYMVVEDGLLRWMSEPERSYYAGSPMDAIEAWMAADREGRWLIDEEIEGMSETSQFPSGWLRRLR